MRQDLFFLYVLSQVAVTSILDGRQRRITVRIHRTVANEMDMGCRVMR